VAASDHLSGKQFTASDVARHSGYDPAVHGPNDPAARFRLEQKFPLSRINVEPASHEELGLPAKHRNSAPIVVSDASRAPHALLHDGWHRARLAKHAGQTHIRAYVRSLD
jgi:hypothetical protein